MTEEVAIPECVDVPTKRWEWHWKAFERARFPSYQRNRSLFGRMLNQMYDSGVDGFSEASSYAGGLVRADRSLRRMAPDVIERTYRTAYENTAREFAAGWEQNRKQLDDQDTATLALTAVRDFLTAGLFQSQRNTLRGHVQKIIGTHSRLMQEAIVRVAANVIGIDPGDPVPKLSGSQLNAISLAARQRLKTRVTPVHSKYFSITETVAASNLGILAVAMASPQQLTKFWLSQRDSRVRDSHVIADGQQIQLNDLFRVGNSLLAFPGDWTHGAQLEEIINCRCVLIFFSQN